MSRNTVITRARQIASGESALSPRVRREGAGRKALIDKDPDLLLVETVSTIRPAPEQRTAGRAITHTSPDCLTRSSFLSASPVAPRQHKWRT
jgi:hypothetical protein